MQCGKSMYKHIRQCGLNLPFENRSWHEAEEECKKKDAHLTSINDIGAQLYLYNAIQANDGWIGLSNTKV